jgi:hypothetical protein
MPQSVTSHYVCAICMHRHDRQGPSTVSIEHEIAVNSAFSNSKPMPYMHAYRPPMSASPPVIIKTPVASTACPTNCSTSCMPSRPASAHRWEMQGSQSTDQVRLHMKPYMYAIYVCPSKTSYEALHVCHTCMPYMYALYVCCLWEMHKGCQPLGGECLICMRI